MRRVRRGPAAAVVLASLGLAFASAACASSPWAGERDPDLIELEEILEAEVRTAYELVDLLRPRWFVSRGPRSLRLRTEIVVYLDGSFMGDVETLRRIPAHTVGSMRALGSAEAGRLPGIGSRHVERAIMVRTRTGVWQVDRFHNLHPRPRRAVWLAPRSSTGSSARSG